jgi:hypothetical protein
MLVGASCYASCLRDRGCSAHPVFPAPSDFWRARFSCKTSGASRREKALCCHHPRKRVIQYSRDADDGNDRPQRTGSSACAGDDACGALRSLLRHCERSEAIHLTAQRKNGLLRRGACHRARVRATRWLLAMTARHKSAFPRRSAPELWIPSPRKSGHRESRVPVAPAASCAKCRKHTS